MMLGGVMPNKTKDTACQVVAKVVKASMEKLESRTADTIRGAVDRRRLDAEAPESAMVSKAIVL